jgi:hypothetical protein
VFEGAPPTIVNYNGPGDLQGVSANAIAWVTSANFAAFSSQSPTILPNIQLFSGTVPRQQDLFRNWQTPLAAISNGGPKVGDTVYASAFERVLPRTLFRSDDMNANWKSDSTTYPNPEEYVYRITKVENSPASSVDHQSQTGYESLTSAEQDQWYVDSGFDINNPYRFKWFAFMCVAPTGGSYILTEPSELKTSYASRQDGILLNGTLDPAHNLMFKDAAEVWMNNVSQGQTLRSVVGSKVNDGPYTDAFLGDQELPWRTIVYGILDVSASCGAGQTLQALPIVDSNNSAITSKSFEITEQLKLEVSGDYFLINTVGASLGVTGASAPPPGFNAALWGLTTVADNTPPPAPPAPPAPLPIISDAAAAQAEAAKKQKELLELLSIIPSLGSIALNLGETTKALTLQKCVKKKQVRFVKKGAKCPKGFVKKK